MDTELVNEIKRRLRIMSKRIIRVGVVILLIILLLGGALYKIKLDDGTYKEGDWANTQYAAEQFMQGTSISQDGKITTNMTAQELWDKLMEEGSRVDLYLDGPDELQKLMNAEMVTQYLDTRPNPDEEINWEKINKVDSNEVQGIVKLKRAKSDGTISTMTYVTPEEFQSYIDAYNASGSEADKSEALKHFTLEKTTAGSNISNVTPIQAGETINIPAGLGSVHTYMGWQIITSTTSTQYKLREQAGMNFDEEGFGRINGRYVIACTLTYGNVGDYVDFYQEDGTIIPCIIGDIKNQNDAGCNEWGHLDGTCIIEFVVDKTTWYNPMHDNPGTPNCHPEWNQNITKAVNGGSYFDNPDFGSEDIKPNEGNSNTDTNTSSGEDILCWPVEPQYKTITSQFGYRGDIGVAGATADHGAIDIAGSGIDGTNVYACENGTVIAVSNDGSYSKGAGNYVNIDHGNGYVTKYFHMQTGSITVKVGDQVTKGQAIGKVGTTGASSGPHCHFQVEYNGEKIDPLTFKYNNGMGNGTGGFGIGSGNVNSNTSTTTSYYAKVATWNEVTNTVESNDPDVQSYSTTTYRMTETKINYQDFISGYTMPFDYLWDLLVVSEDQGFVSDLAQLVLDSEIEITVHDNLSINTNVNTYTYKENEKIVSDNVKIVGVSQEGGTMSASPTEPGIKINSVDRKVVRTVITKTNTLDISLTKADVWIVKYVKKYTYEVPENVVTQGGAGNMEDIPYTDSPDHKTNSDDIGYAESQRQIYHNQWLQQYPDISTSVQSVQCSYYYSTTNRNESIVNTLQSNKYVSSPGKIEEEKTDKNSKEPNFVTILLDDNNTEAKHNILGTSSWLFAVLEQNDTTKDVLLDLTKYLLYKASGNTKYWDPDEQFDFSIFNPDNFKNNAGGKSGIDGVPGQIYDFLLEKGVPPVGAAAILGNIQAESSFNPSSVNSSGHSGLCQWDPDRFAGLKKLASEKGKDWTDVEIQLEYIWQELNGSFSDVKDVIMSATQESDMEYATWYFGRNYEIYFTGTWPSSKDQSATRYKYAQEWYQKYKQNSKSANGGGTIYYQNDYASVPYGDSNMEKCGCGPTCFAMVATDYSGRQITPEDAVSWCGNTYYELDKGTSWSYFAAAASHFNLPCSVIDLGNDINAAVNQLKNGNLVISSQGPGIFTNAGHFILLSSVDSSGGIKVRDPNKSNAVGKGYKDRTFSASEISASGKNYWAFVK